MNFEKFKQLRFPFIYSGGNHFCRKMDPLLQVERL